MCAGVVCAGVVCAGVVCAGVYVCECQVSYWFVNARKRIWQPLLHEKHAGTLTGYAKVTAADMLRQAAVVKSSRSDGSSSKDSSKDGKVRATETVSATAREAPLDGASGGPDSYLATTASAGVCVPCVCATIATRSAW